MTIDWAVHRYLHAKDEGDGIAVASRSAPQALAMPVGMAV